MSKVDFDFDIDRFIDRIVFRSFVHKLPKPVSWFLGHRSPSRPAIGSLLVWFWSFIGAFCGILVVEAVYHTETLRSDGTPIVIASLGAAAILEYNTIDSPLAQPRNALLGQFFSAIIGVGITKLFALNSNFENLRWIAGALSVGLASAFMGFTKTVHPPAGATALLAATSPEITRLGWHLVPLIMLGSGLLLGVACVINNIQRQFPMYWWTPNNPSRSKDDIERQDQNCGELRKDEERSSHDTDLRKTECHILIDDDHIIIPDWLCLDSEEASMLEILRSKLQEGLRNARSTESDEMGGL